MKKFIHDNLLIVVIIGAIALALAAPGAGQALKALPVSGPIVFAIFLFQGLSLKFDRRVTVARAGRTAAGGLAVTYLLFPALAFLATRTGLFDAAETVGLSLICCMTPTVVSGVVMASRARGDHTLALVLTVALSLAGVFTIPLNLRWLLRTVVAVDGAGLLRGLLGTALLPSVLGWALRRRIAGLGAIQAVMKTGQVYLLGFLLFISLSGQSRKLLEISPTRLLLLAAAALLLHLTVLAAGYALSRGWLRNDEARSRSFAIVCSEKSLALGIPVWASAFAATHPLSILPPVIFHFCQIFIDGIIAERWGKKAPGKAS